MRWVAKALAERAEELDEATDALTSLQAAEIDRRARFPDPFQHARRSALLDGFSLHAGVRVHGNDREGLERLCRYILRPPLALSRLSQGEEGELLYRMKRPRRGSRLLMLTPDQLVGKLATLVPPPRVHGVRYHGVFAPHSKARSRVVPAGAMPAAPTPEPAPGKGQASQERPVRPSRARCPRPAYRVPWAELLKKVFAVDVLESPECSGRMELIAFISGLIAKQILEHLGLETTGPPLTRATGSAEAIEGSPDYDAADPQYAD